MIGLFGLLALFTGSLTDTIKENIEIQVFLRNNLEETEVYEVQVLLSEKEYIDAREEKARIRFVSREEAAEEMINENGEDFIKFLGENPLRNAFVINIRPDYQTNQQMDEIKADIEQIPYVYEVVYTPNLVNEINANIDAIGLVIGFFVVILMATVVILINNSIKLAVFSQRFLIRSMQLVGATSLFIKKPFLQRAAWHGALAGLIASGILLVLVVLAANQLQGFQEIMNPADMLLVFGLLVMLGMAVSFSSAYAAVSKYLGMQLDELY